MTKLMKYEWRKTMFSKLIIIVIMAIAEVAYLVGVFMDKVNWLGAGAAGLTCCAIFGIIYIGVESLLTLSKDLNTKQSYMLFLTPHTSYEILGAKVLTNALSILVAGVFCAALAAVDVSIGVLHIGGVKEFLRMLEGVLQIRIDWQEFGRDGAIIFATLLTSWLMTIVVGELAIVLSATAFAGKKYSGFVSFVIFLVINWVVSAGVERLPNLHNMTAQWGMQIGLLLVMTVIFYLITGWIMEKKLSV